MMSKGGDMAAIFSNRFFFAFSQNALTKSMLRKSMSLKSVLLILSAFFFVACTKNDPRLGIDPAPEFKAALAVEDSFQSVPTEVEPTAKKDMAHVVIARTALEKEFLLTTNMLSQVPTPLFSSLQSRIVYFTLKNERVYMLEATAGRTVGINNPKSFLPLAEFEILNQTTTDITIDFNLGMRRLITVSEMAGSDFPESAAWKSVEVNFSYLQSVDFSNNRFFIRQIAQVQMDTLVPLEIRYYLAPYNPDPNFIPTKSPGFDQVGYFEANPLLDVHGNTINYAMKFNLNKPIIFAISANTPADYKETVRNGILYWNKTLGENKIQVIELTDSELTAPNPDYNIVQWTNWDSAGYAFADAHIDPRSGEVTHAQVFFPSAFTEAAIEKRVRVIEGSQRQFSLNGFKQNTLCRRNVVKEFSKSIQFIEGSASGSISKEAMQKAVKDYVFEVIAHEIGHVLGLRHNFAGNLTANYDGADRRGLALSYYKNMAAPEGIISSSSVMEYSRFEESSWNGDKLQKNAPALAHDLVTMQYLYKNIEIPKDAPVFCTDTRVNIYADCNRGDAARSIVSYASGNYQYGIETLPVRILNQFISQAKISDDPGVPTKPVQNVLLDAEAYAMNLATDRYKFLSLLKNEVRLIQVRAPLYPIWPARSEQVFTLEKDFVAEEIARLGGLSAVINLSEKDLAHVWIEKFNALLADPNYNQGTIGSKTYAFTAAEIETMQRQFNLFAEKVKSELIQHNLHALGGGSISFEESYGQARVEATRGWFEHAVTEELASVVQAISGHYIFAKENARTVLPVVLKDGATNTVELPVYSYPQEIRKAAALVWKAPHVAIEWAYLEKPLHAAEIKTELAVLAEADKIDFTKTNKIILRWLLHNKEIQATLN